MENIKPGDIVRASFTFTDLSTQKVRPALILALAVLDDAVVAAITSTTAIRNRFDYQLVDWQEAGLDKVSVVQLTKLYTLNQSLFESIIGHLSSRDWTEIKKRWLELLD
jgi:mRNA interferase MazF